MKPIQKFATAAILCGVVLFQAISLQAETVREELAGSRFKLVHEVYANNNWELFVTAVNGKSSVNLTNTPDVNELYPQASPDGSRAFVNFCTRPFTFVNVPRFSACEQPGNK